jgi:hypothetical protein
VSVSSVAFSQEDAWVYFNAKSDSQSYLDSPLNMLSKRAIEEEQIKIAIDLKDVPITPAYINQIKSIGITVMAKSKWMNALHIRGNQAVINSLKDSLCK